MKKPTFKEYSNWLKTNKNIDLRKLEVDYKHHTDTAKRHLLNHNFWSSLQTTEISNIEQSYQNIQPNFSLFSSSKNEIVVKPFQSFLEKTWRHNVLNNTNFDKKKWPDNSPEQGWFWPNELKIYSQLNDVLRTTFTVKYLDGIQFLADKIVKWAGENGLKITSPYLEARDEGYYGLHLYIEHNIRLQNDENLTVFKVEIQITTQTKALIKQLTHAIYEQQRTISKNKKLTKWQWDFESDEFEINYFGHLVHYLEAQILKMRLKQFPPK